MKMEESRILIQPSLLESDPQVLLYTPSVLRELHRRQLKGDDLLQLVCADLSQGLTPRDWLKHLVDSGQFALARLLMKNFGEISVDEFKRLSRPWRDRANAEIKRIERKLDSQREIVGHLIAADFDDRVDEVDRLIEGYWYDLALDQSKQIEASLDNFTRDATRELEQRFDQAQKKIMQVRREFMYADRMQRKQSNLEIAWELLNYADRLSASPAYSLSQIDELCDAVRQIHQGAPVNEEILAKYRAIYRSNQQFAGISPQIIQNSDEVSASDLIIQKVEFQPLSLIADEFLNQIIGDDFSPLKRDIQEIKIRSDEIWNEKTVRQKQSHAKGLIMGLYDTELSEKMPDLLQDAVYILRYWSEKRKAISDTIHKELSVILSAYAQWKAEAYLEDNQIDSANEYYRIAIKMAAIQRSLAPVQKTLLDYLVVNASNNLAGRKAAQQLEIEKEKFLIPEKLSAWAIQVARESAKLINAAGQTAWAIVKLALTDEWLFEILKKALDEELDDKNRQWLETAFDGLAKQVNASVEGLSLSEKLEKVMLSYQESREQLYAALRSMVGFSKETSTLRVLPGNLKELKSIQHIWEQTESKLVNLLLPIGEKLSQYFDPNLAYQEKAGIVGELTQHQIPMLLQHARNAPTVMGSRFVVPMVENILLNLEEEQITLRQVSLPRIEIQVEQSQWRTDAYYYCQLLLRNEGEIRANNVALYIQNSHEYQLVDSRATVGVIYPGDKRSVNVRIMPTSTDETQSIITLLVQVRYEVPDRDRYEQRFFRLRVEDFSVVKPRFTTITNPYLAGPIVMEDNMFKGRDDMIQDLLALVADARRTGSAVIFGQKRSGKSSLLYHLAKRAPDNILAVQFDIPTILTSLPEVKTSANIGEKEEMLGRLLLAIAEKTVMEAKRKGIKVKGMTWREIIKKPGPDFQFRVFLEQFKDREDGMHVLYLFDEFTGLIQKVNEAVIDDSILKLFKSLIEHGYMSCMICGLTEVYDAVLKYANQLAVTQPKQVDYLDVEPAYDLIETPIAMSDGTSRYLSQDVVHEIYELTQGSPWYIQTFCKRLVDHMNTMGFDRISVADVDDVLKSLIEGEERLDPVQFENLYQYKGTTNEPRASVLEGLIVHLIAHETIQKPYVPFSVLQKRIQKFVTEDEVEETLSRLEQRRTIIQQVDEPSKKTKSSQPLRSRHYRIRVDLFQQWLLANRPMDENALESFEHKLRR
jgi:hypothetical protein